MSNIDNLIEDTMPAKRRRQQARATRTAKLNAKPTEGPYFQCEQTRRPHNHALIGIGNGAVHVGYASVTPALSPFEADANARLFAASWELKQALEIIRDSDGDKEDMRAMAITTLEKHGFYKNRRA